MSAHSGEEEEVIAPPPSLGFATLVRGLPARTRPGIPKDMMSADATDALKAAVSALPAITSPLFALATASGGLTVEEDITSDFLRFGKKNLNVFFFTKFDNLERTFPESRRHGTGVDLIGGIGRKQVRSRVRKPARVRVMRWDCGARVFRLTKTLPRFLFGVLFVQSPHRRPR